MLHTLIKAKAILPPEHVTTNPFTEYTYFSKNTGNPAESFLGEFFRFTVLLFLSSTKYSKVLRM